MSINIPMIPYGLRQEETMVQIASALDSIDCLVNDVFQQIEDNIVKHRKYLSNLQKRSKIIASKVDKLAGKNDVATTVHSHHKFPSEETSSFDTLFNINLKSLEKKPSVSIEGGFQHVKHGSLANKLRVFHVKPETKPTEKELILEKGLGNLPADADCLSSLLLFNTSKNLYQKYVQLDPLAMTNDSKLVPEEKKKNDIAAAPASIITEQVFQNEDYFKGFYTPAYEEMPSINVPLDLPDLPGIAGNLKFNTNYEPPIAPSKQAPGRQKVAAETTAPAPSVVKEISPPTAGSDEIVNVPLQNPPGTSSDPACTPPLPAPLPPPTSLMPPPPPPLPPPLPNFKEPDKKAPKDSHNESKSAVPPTENVHATLMEAIRKAGGKEKAMLRPVNHSAMNTESTNSIADTTFLGELYNTLAMRRKGISGKKETSNKLDGVMERVSALIPASSDSTDESDDNDDVDVTEDWDD